LRGDPIQANEGVARGSTRRSTCADPTTKMTRGAESSSSAAKRAKKDKEDPLVRIRNELILVMKEQGNKAVRKVTISLLIALHAVCTELEAANRKLLGKLPPELWSKIVDENLDENDELAFAMTCRFFREQQENLGWMVQTNVNSFHLLDLRKSGRMPPSHSLGWFQWVCDTFEILPGFEYDWSAKKVKGAVYEGDLVNYAAFQGSVKILRWLVEEKGWELNGHTGKWAGMGGSVAVLEYLSGKGYEFKAHACAGAALGGHLEALKCLRGLERPGPWDWETCECAAQEGHLEVLKWATSQNSPCPFPDDACAAAARWGHLHVLKWVRDQDPSFFYSWPEEICSCAAQGGHLDVLKFLRGLDPPCPWDERTCAAAARGGRLEALKFLRGLDPPCPWSRRYCREDASLNGHQHVIDWIDQQEDESDVESSDSD